MPANNGKKTILLLSDDLRMSSGIATESREIVINTAHKYNWIQLAGAITHPDKGKVFDLSEATNKMLNINDSYVKLYPTDGYGNEQILFQVIGMEQVNAVVHFTDPRFWIWLYGLEHQLRSNNIPLIFYNIWDSTPYPMYNRAYYESCDALLSISKQTYNINKAVMYPENCMTVDGEFDKDGNFIKRV